MYPPVPSLLPRRVPKGGAMVDGEFVPGGTTLGVHQLSTYRSEANFKNAHEFRPVSVVALSCDIWHLS